MDSSIAVVDHLGRVTTAAGRWPVIASEDVEVEVGADFVELCERAGTEAAACVARAVRAVLAGDETSLALRHPNAGHGSWSSVSITSLGSAGGVLVAQNDITAQADSERRERVQTVACAEVRGDRLVWVNAAWAELLAATEEALLQSVLWDHVHSDDAAFLNSVRELPDGQPFRGKVQLIRTDGRPVNVAWSSARAGDSWHISAMELVDDSHRAFTPYTAEDERRLGFGSFSLDLRTGVLHVSEYLSLMLVGKPTSSAEARRMLMADDWKRLREAVDALESNSPPGRITVQLLAGGVLTPVEVWLSPVVEGDTIAAVRGTVRDMSLQRGLVAQLDRRNVLLDMVGEAVVGLDLEGRVLDWNAAAQRLYGVRASDAIGRNFGALLPQLDSQRAEAAVDEALRRHGSWETDIDLALDGDRPLRIRLREVLLTGPDGTPSGRVSIASDVSASSRLEQRLDATRHSLTAVAEKMADGLFTLDESGRLTFMNESAERILDWRFEDLHGRLLHSVIHYRRPDGSVLALEDSPITVSRRENRTVHVTEDTFLRRDGTPVTVEYTSTPIVADSGDRTTVVVFSDVTAKVEREARLRVQVETLSKVNSIRESLARNEIELLAQPVVDVEGEQALFELRITPPGAGGLFTDEDDFWRTAEAQGLRPDLDTYLLREAARLREGGAAVIVEVAPSCLGDAGCAAALEQAAGARATAPLTIEISEGAALADLDGMSAFLTRARELGCRIMVAGIGAGPSGFRYLQQLPVDLLKIHPLLVREMSQSNVTADIVSAVVRLARALEIKALAPGVENAETVALVRRLGIDYMQGPYIAAPEPPDPRRSNADG